MYLQVQRQQHEVFVPCQRFCSGTGTEAIRLTAAAAFDH